MKTILQYGLIGKKDLETIRQLLPTKAQKSLLTQTVKVLERYKLFITVSQIASIITTPVTMISMVGIHLVTNHTTQESIIYIVLLFNTVSIILRLVQLHYWNYGRRYIGDIFDDLLNIIFQYFGSVQIVVVPVITI